MKELGYASSSSRVRHLWYRNLCADCVESPDKNEISINTTNTRDI